MSIMGMNPIASAGMTMGDMIFSLLNQKGASTMPAGLGGYRLCRTGRVVLDKGQAKRSRGVMTYYAEPIERNKYAKRYAG